MKLRQGEINLWVTDLDRAAGFYMQAFGFEECERGETYRKVQHGDITLTFFRAREAEPAPDFGMGCMMTTDFITDEFDACVEGITQAGGIVQETQTNEGKRFTLFRDLDGINWELIEA